MTQTLGIIKGMAHDEYHAVDAASHSRLVAVRRSLAHCRHRLDHPEDSEGLIFGRAVHSVLLEPAGVENAFTVAGICQARKRDGERCANGGKHHVGGQWYCGIHVKADRHAESWKAAIDRLGKSGFAWRLTSESGSQYFVHREDGREARLSDHAANLKTAQWIIRNDVMNVRVDLPPYGNDDPRDVIAQAEYDDLLAMRAAIQQHGAAHRLLIAGGEENELSGFWHDDEHGVLCKLRADRVVTLPGYGTVCVDLKTTTDASPNAFRRALNKWGYHVQAGWYLHGLAKLGVPCEAFVIVAVEKSPPHGVGVYRINDDTVEQGYREARRLLARYAGAVKTGVWGGYSDKIEEIGLAAWDFDDEETI